MTIDFKGKVAVVSGAGRGIGRAIALRLGELGAAVAVNARTASQLERTAAELREKGVPIMATAMDIADWDACERFAAEVHAEHGRVDFLINNAGVGADAAAVADSDPAAWAAMVTTNVIGTYNMCRAFLEHLGEGSKIVNFGSGNGHTPAPIRSAYGTSKAAISMFTEYLATEVWDRGIDVNEFIPGPVATEMLIFAAHLGDEQAIREHYVGYTSPENPSEIVKSPETVAEHVAYLCAQRNRGPTGQIYSLMRRPIRA